MQRFLGWLGLVALSWSLCPAFAHGDDSYAVVAIKKLEVTEGQLPPAPPPVGQQRGVPEPAGRDYIDRYPYVVLEGEGEAFLDPGNAPAFVLGFPPSHEQMVAVRTRTKRDVSGILVWPAANGQPLKVRFRIPETAFNAEKRVDFFQARLNHYSRLVATNVPGGAWFRHQVLETRRELAGVDVKSPAFRPGAVWAGSLDLQDSFTMLSGERAIHENLQLDRQLMTPIEDGAQPETVALDSITGITARDLDWTERIRGRSPKKDSLAKLIPDDQHAAFFPSFAALAAVVEAPRDAVAPLQQLFSSRAELRNVQLRYENQLGVSLATAQQLMKFVGGDLVTGIAVTSGDPYFVTGTDLAILVESTQAKVLHDAVVVQIMGRHQGKPDAQHEKGVIANTPYQAWRSPDRRVSSYVAQLDNVVVITNSPTQLKNVIDVQQGRLGNLASLAEFTYFRDRYLLGDADESALVVISDKTIRRWCGPKWRIGAARRIQAAAVMAEVQAAHLDELVTGKAKVGELPGDAPAATGRLSLSPRGVSSAIFGTLEFQTPIAEIPLDRVTVREAESYQQWRNSYQQFWRRGFDPIAVRLSVAPQRIAFDATIVPLIDSTSYRDFKQIAGNVVLPPQAGDPHRGSLVHVIMAVDRNSKSVTVDLLRNMSTSANSRDPNSFDWFGGHIAIYVDDDPVWARLAQTPLDQVSELSVISGMNLPVAVSFSIADRKRLTPFLNHVKSMINNLLSSRARWTEVKHGELTYSKFALATPEAGKADNLGGFLHKDFQLFSFVTDDQWLISLNEDLVRRAIDRHLARAGAAEGDKPEPARPSWLGDHVALEIDGSAAQALEGLLHVNYHRGLRTTSWRNLPILNEWRQRYPDVNPVELHARFFQAKLECPSGAAYRWNEAYLTMESATYGHPAQPREAVNSPSFLLDLKRFGLGTTFENDGLRARGVWERRAPSEVKP